MRKPVDISVIATRGEQQTRVFDHFRATADAEPKVEIVGTELAQTLVEAREALTAATTQLENIAAPDWAAHQ